MRAFGAVLSGHGVTRLQNRPPHGPSCVPIHPLCPPPSPLSPHSHQLGPQLPLSEWQRGNKAAETPGSN